VSEEPETAEPEHDWASLESQESQSQSQSLELELPAIWSAVDAIDAHLVELEEEAHDWGSGPVENVGGALEEVRDHVAAAFDVVRELAGNLVPFVEQIDVLSTRTGEVDRSVAGLVSSVDNRFGRVEQGMGELADWIEARFETLEEAIGNDLDDLGDEIGEVRTAAAPAARRPSVFAPESTETVADVVTFLAERLDDIAVELSERQERLEQQMARLTEEVTQYRRRVQVHARPPVVTDEQIQAVIEGVASKVQESLAAEDSKGRRGK
jgi:hypothetical protein